VAPVCEPFFVKTETSVSLRVFFYNDQEEFEGTTLTVPSAPSSAFLSNAVVGDFTGDGVQDIYASLIIEWPGVVRSYLFEGLCDRQFKPHNLTGLGGLDHSETFTEFISAVDVDADGDLDLLGWHFEAGRGATALNKGNGLSWEYIDPEVGNLFQLQWWNVTDDWDLQWSFASPPAQVFDSSDIDLLECAGSNNIPGTGGGMCHFYRGTESLEFHSAFDFGVSWPVSGVALADVMGGAQAEVVLVSSSDSQNPGLVSAWDSPQSGESLDFPGVALFDLLPEAQDPLPSGSGGESWIYPGDWNQDGRTDFVCSVTAPGNPPTTSLIFALQNEEGGFTLELIESNLGHSFGPGVTNRPDFIGVPALP